MLLYKLFRRKKLSGKNQSAHFFQIGKCLFAVLIPLISGPQRLLVQSQFLLLRLPKDHGPQTAVSDRQRLFPYVRRLTIKKFHT